MFEALRGLQNVPILKHIMIEKSFNFGMCAEMHGNVRRMCREGGMSITDLPARYFNHFLWDHLC